jgi:hypothetical protein
MAKVKVDWKQLLLQKGERIALGIAGGLCALMVLSMFWYLLFGPSSKRIVEALDKPTKALAEQQRNARPTDADLPPKLANGGQLVELKQLKVDDPEKYQVAQFFTATPFFDPSTRYKPNIKSPTEAVVDLCHVPVRTYIFDKPLKKIAVLKGATGGGGETRPMQPGTKEGLKAAGGLYGARPGRGGPGGGLLPPGPGGERGPGAPPIYQPPSLEGLGAETAKKDAETLYIPVEKIADQQDRLAETVAPMRMAIITTNFPYRAQLEEFRTKLNLKTLAEVLADTTGEVDETTRENVRANLPAFRFLGVNVQRVVVGADGKPLKLNDKGEPAWETVDLAREYRLKVYINGKRFEQDAPGVEAISFPGLVMPKLALMRKDQYPQSETKLPTLQKTIEDLAKLSTDQVTKPKNPLAVDDFDPFDPRPSGAAAQPGSDLLRGEKGGDRPLPPRERPMLPEKGGLPERGVPGDPASVNPDAMYPEYCLIRLIDIDVKPGKIYKYRIQVKMANPNYGKTNAASPAYSTSKEPLVSDWFEIKQLVSVPPEYHVYAVDQQYDFDPKKYDGQHKDLRPDPNRHVVLQIHKWLEKTDQDARSYQPVGEWSVAERAFAVRGEYVGRKQRVEVPYWRFTQESYVMAKDPADKTGKVKGIVVDFSPPNSDPMILVDFMGGTVDHVRPKDPVKKDDKTDPPAKVETAKITDHAGYEVLLLSPGGKLLEHDAWADRSDSERVKSLKEWRDRIKEVKEGGKDGGGIFGPGGQPKDKPERPGS